MQLGFYAFCCKKTICVQKPVGLIEPLGTEDVKRMHVELKI